MGIERDLSSPLPWRRSLRASRVAAAPRRRRRRVLRGRAGVTLAVATMAFAAAGAVAQDSPPASGGGSAAIGRARPSGPRSSVPSASPPTASTARRPGRRCAASSAARVSPWTAWPAPRPSPRSAVRRRRVDRARQRHLVVGGAGSSRALGERDARRIAAVRVRRRPDRGVADGQYRGKYQFDRATWELMGGSGDPAQRPRPSRTASPPSSSRSAARRPGPSAAT